jgi:hypothetical protein
MWRKTRCAGNDQLDRENHGFVAIIFPLNLPQLKEIIFKVKSRIITVTLVVRCLRNVVIAVIFQHIGFSGTGGGMLLFVLSARYTLGRLLDTC